MNTEDRYVSSGEPIRCAIYVRTASTPQTKNDAAADEQIERCREAARKNGWVVVDDCVRIDRGKSGTSMQGRSGLQELIALAATKPRPFDYLMCVSTDRLARNLSIAGEIVNAFTHHGVNLYFAYQGIGFADPIFDEFLHGNARKDALYMKCLGDKVRRGKMGRFLSGYHPGGRCFGYTSVPEEVPDRHREGGRAVVIGIKQVRCDSEAKVVKRIFEGYASGLGLTVIARQLNADGVPPPQGARAAKAANWSSGAIATILGNEMYVGRARWNRTRMVRNPATGKLEGKARPKDEWLTLDKPELRIISDDLFE